MRPLTAEWILAVADKPRGFRVLYEFLQEFNEGTIPKTEATIAVARAFRKILDDGADAAVAALQLKWGRGRKPGRSWRDSQKRYGKIWEFMRERLDRSAPGERKPARGAMEAAIADAMQKFKKDRTSIQRAWKDYRTLYFLTREACWKADRILAACK